MFRLILSVGSGYFPEQHEVVGLYNRQCIYFKLYTDSMPPNGCSAGQDTLRLLWARMFQQRDHKNPLLGPTLTQPDSSSHSHIQRI